ncbi:MAG: DUF2191 domain-containing protein [Planctomycetes bacterium]|nr:DUF2191 domain-containing protein [Planctomycetota bacterium]
MPRTTLTLDDDLFKRLRRMAAEQGCAFKDLVNRLLRSALAPPPRTGYRLKWRTERGKIQPGVNLDDRDALFDLMDGR